MGLASALAFGPRLVCEDGSTHLAAAMGWARSIREKEALAYEQGSDKLGQYVARVALKERGVL